MSMTSLTLEQQLKLVKALDSKERDEKEKKSLKVEEENQSAAGSLLLPNSTSHNSIPLNSFPSDHRQYRLLNLANGLRVLLIENNKAHVAQAMLSVEAGSFDEPDEFPGLAHFLEHMVFQGCAKYPEDNEYKMFITNHGGSIDACTKEEETYFSFSIEHQYFEEALDRLAGFFINPFLNAEYAEREVQAVHMEFTGNLDKDGFRVLHICKNLVNREHPEHRFNWGNIDTLKDVEKVLPALRAFHQKYYTADRMILVLDSKNPLQDLERLAVQYFLPVPRAIKPFVKPLRKPRIQIEGLGVTLHLESVEENLFGLSFIFSQKKNHRA